MTREEWLHVKDVTAAALEQPEAARAAFIGHSCGGDEPLEREVRSLLASAISASPLFETPVFATATAASVIANVTRISPTRAGARLGACEAGVGAGERVAVSRVHRHVGPTH
jgi:hypothetical protein